MPARRLAKPERGFETMRRVARVILIATLLVSEGLLFADCGGPQGSPESVARAFAEACTAGDYDQATSYISPDKRHIAPCDEILFSIRIDEAIVRTAVLGMGEEVTLMGDFRAQDGWTSEKYRILTEELNGKWYVSRWGYW
jgi:hypothetical protein